MVIVNRDFYMNLNNTFSQEYRKNSYGKDQEE